MKTDAGIIFFVCLGVFFAVFWEKLTNFTFNTPKASKIQGAGPNPLEVRVANLEALVSRLVKEFEAFKPKKDDFSDKEKKVKKKPIKHKNQL